MSFSLIECNYLMNNQVKSTPTATFDSISFMYTHKYIYTCIYACTYIYAHVYMYMFVCLYVYVCSAKTWWECIHIHSHSVLAAFLIWCPMAQVSATPSGLHGKLGLTFSPSYISLSGTPCNWGPSVQNMRTWKTF